MGLFAARFSTADHGELPLYEMDGHGFLRARECGSPLRGAKKNGRTEEPSAGIIDSQSVKGTAESAEESGFDGWKKVKGRKHHIVTDTTGCVLAVAVHAANVHDSQGAYPLLKKLFKIVPTLRRIWADQAYQGELVQWVKATFSCELEIVQRTTKAFKVLPRRWVVERTLAWLSRSVDWCASMKKEWHPVSL